MLITRVIPLFYIGLFYIEYKPLKFLPHDAMHIADYAVARCLSVTCRYYVETAERVGKLFTRVATP